jgi:hypothetical protein
MNRTGKDYGVGFQCSPWNLWLVVLSWGPGAVEKALFAVSGPLKMVRGAPDGPF